MSHLGTLLVSFHSSEVFALWAWCSCSRRKKTIPKMTEDTQLPTTLLLSSVTSEPTVWSVVKNMNLVLRHQWIPVSHGGALLMSTNPCNTRQYSWNAIMTHFKVMIKRDWVRGRWLPWEHWMMTGLISDQVKPYQSISVSFSTVGGALTFIVSNQWGLLESIPQYQSCILVLH